MPPLASLRRGPADSAEPGALDDDIDINVDVGGVTGMVSGAEVLDQIAFRAGSREVDDVHLVAALRAEQACHQPDRPGAGDQRPAPHEECAPRDLVHLVPRLGQHRRRFQQDAELARPGQDRHGEIRLHPPTFASVPVQADDAALAETVGPAHVPLTGGTRRARRRIGPPHDPDHKIARHEA